MEISLAILIPIYNLSVVDLVEELTIQLKKTPNRISIFCMDDGSNEEIKKINASYLKENSSVFYEELPHNIGRAKIRNLLAEKANEYSHFLFLDNDVQPTHSLFLENYLLEINKNKKTVLCGGREAPPLYLKKGKELNWTYDTYRQSFPAKKREENNFLELRSFNFCIPKEIFHKYPFPDWENNYGHEDTLFAFQLYKHTIPIKHIDNHLLHLGLEKNDVFLKKTEDSIKNISLLKEEKELLPHLKIWKVYTKIIPFSFLLHPVSSFLLPVLKKYLIRSKKPDLLIFDLYKLLFLLHNSTHIRG